MRYVAIALCTAALTACPALADAQSDADTGTPTTAPAAAPSPFTFSGYLAGSFDDFDTTPALRAFDTRKHGFVFNQAAATFAFLPAAGFGGQVTVIGGEDAKAIRLTETWPTPSHGSPYDLYNAFVQYASGPVTVMAGKYSTLAGAEVTSPASDSLVSRSLLFTMMEPLTHTGVRAVYAVSPTLTLTAGVNNGWNFSSAPSGAGQSLELGASGGIGAAFTYSAALYRGDSPLYGGNPTGALQLIDLVANFKLGPTLALGANADLLSKQGAASAGGTGHTNGLALYATWTPDAKWQAALRGEAIDDKDGMITGIAGNTLQEASIAGSYFPTPSLRLSLELRRDHSARPYFIESGQQQRSQTSIEAQAVYSF
jgi:hypothetical protein